MLDLSVVILTYNEEKNIKECIESVKSIASKLYVIDSFSTDSTVQIAEENGAVVFQHEFINQSKQYKWAMSQIDFKTKWVLRLDADERITIKAAEEITQLLQIHDSDDVNGIVLRFEVSFLGKKLKHGGIYPFQKMSLYRNGFADIEDKAMDEHFILLSGRYVFMKNDCEHKDYKDISSWIDKHNKYSSREATDYLSHFQASGEQMDEKTGKKQKYKYGMYYKAPSFLRAKLYYWYRLIIKGAWLDGREGKIFAFLQAYWYRYLVDVKIYESASREKI